MKLICFDLSFHLAIPQRQVYEQGGGYEVAHRADFGGGRGRGGPRRPGGVEPPPEAEAAQGEAPREGVSPALAAAPAEGGDRAREGKKRDKVKRAVDRNLQAGINQFKPQIETDLRVEVLRGNLDKLQLLAAFLRTHKPSDAKIGRASTWNHDFCVQILNAPGLSAREERYAAYALQQVLDEKFRAHGSGYERREGGRLVDGQSRIDGWMGAYTTNALFAYLYHECQGNIAGPVWRQFWEENGYSDQSGSAYLNDIYLKRASEAT